MCGDVGVSRACPGTGTWCVPPRLTEPGLHGVQQAAGLDKREVHPSEIGLQLLGRPEKNVACS